MLIKYNKTNIHAMGSPDGKEIEWLKPGWNDFPNSMWAHHKDHPEIQTLIDNGDIEFKEVPAVSKSGKTLKNQTRYLGEDSGEVKLSDVSDEKAAIDIVKSTNDKNLVQRWLDQETRFKVKRALENQLKSFDNSGNQKSSEH